MSELQRLYKESGQQLKGFSGSDFIGGLLAVLEPILLQFIQEQVKSLLCSEKPPEEKK